MDISNYNYVLEIGKSPELSVFEIESLVPVGCDCARSGKYVYLSELPSSALSLGGVIKWFEILGEATNEKGVIDMIVSHISSDEASFRDTKYLMSFDWQVSSRRIYPLEIKDELKKLHINSAVAGERSATYTTSGTIIQRKILKKGAHFLIHELKKGTIVVSKLMQVQDIKTFELKDYGKPVRDPRRGMMPPKVARMILNIARGQYSKLGQTKPPVVWDPFCGLGSTGLECLDLGVDCILSDADQKAVNGAKDNTDWYKNKLGLPATNGPEYSVLDACNMPLKLPFHGAPNIVCAEGFLGDIFLKSTFDLEKTAQQRKHLEDFYLKFFSRLANIRDISVVVLALPFWLAQNHKVFLDSSIYAPVLNQYRNMVSQESGGPGKLLYFREDSLVGRDIVVLAKL